MLGFISNNRESPVISFTCVTELSLLNKYLPSSNLKIMQNILQCNTVIPMLTHYKKLRFGNGSKIIKSKMPCSEIMKLVH